MSGPFGSQHWMYGGGFYDHTIDNSARFSDASNTNLIFTPGTPSSTSVWTMSVWMKKYNPNASQPTNEFFSAGGGSAYTFFAFNASQYFAAATEQSGTKNKLWYNRAYRDTAAWFHLVLRSDLGQSTQADRLRLYINGELQTHTSDGITMSSWSYVNASGVTQNWGGKTGSANGNPGCDFYLADINFTDGQSYEPTEFGETKDGVWIPKDPSVTYGNNGYRLEFKQTGTGGASSSTIGADTSGNNNHFTDSGFAAHDIVPDSPTNNFATLTPMTNIALSEGNLKMTTSRTGNWDGTIGSFGVTSGKWYYEVRPTVTTDSTFRCVAGWQGNQASQTVTYNGKGASGSPYGTLFDNYLVNVFTTSFYKDGGTDGTMTAASSGDVINVAADFDNGKIYFGINGTYYANDGGTDGNPSAGTNESLSGIDLTVQEYVPAFNIRSDNATGGNQMIVNFGQEGTFVGTETAGGYSDANGVGNFFNPVPSGFLALASSNLEDSTIGPNSTEQADDFFDIVLYSGNGTAIASGGNAITSVNFAPEFVWLKKRSGNANHALYSVVQGAGVGVITSQDSYSSFNNSETLNSFDSNGFTLGSNNIANDSGSTNIGWNWKLGGTPTVDNSAGAGAVPTAGSVKINGVNSTAALAGTIPALRQSANTTSGISITKYVGTGSVGTVAHSLTQAPEFVLTKSLDSTKDWMVYSDIAGPQYYLRLNGATDGIKPLATSTAVWNDTAPTNSVVTLGTSTHHNNNGDNNIMWAFHSVEGYCKITEYRGNGNSEGPFCFLGFRARFFIIRSRSSTNNRHWPLFNTETYTFNSDTEVFFRVNTNDDEFSGSTRDIDILSNGLKIRGTSNNINSNGERYLVFAFAENPFKYANAR